MMDVEAADAGVSRIAAAIAEPARTRMLFCLMDGRARTSTELAAIAGVSAATASTHLTRMRGQGLLRVVAQGRHRYYSLAGRNVAAVLEALSRVAGAPLVTRSLRTHFTPSTPAPLRSARTCYDHMAGALAVSLHDRLRELQWLRATRKGGYELTESGASALGDIGIDVESARGARRRFAFACLDWSERRPHLGGALGAALLQAALDNRWMTQDLDSRVLRVTQYGRQQFKRRFGLVYEFTAP